MTWSLHIVGQELEDEVKTIGAELVKVVESHGHTLVSTVLGTDAGSEDVPLTPPEPDVKDDVPPSVVDPPADPLSEAVSTGITT